MSRVRTVTASVLIAGTVTVAGFAPSGAMAQPDNPSATDKAKSAAQDVSKWTQKQWDAAKAKWAKEQERWDSCNKQGTDRKLSGRAGWSFIYNCMAS